MSIAWIKWHRTSDTTATVEVRFDRHAQQPAHSWVSSPTTGPMADRARACGDINHDASNIELEDIVLDDIFEFADGSDVYRVAIWNPEALSGIGAWEQWSFREPPANPEVGPQAPGWYPVLRPDLAEEFNELTHVPMAARDSKFGEWAAVERDVQRWRPLIDAGVIAVDLSAWAFHRAAGHRGGTCPVYSTNEAAPLEPSVLETEDLGAALTASGITHVIFSEAELDRAIAVRDGIVHAVRINDYPHRTKMYIVPVSVAF